MRALGGVCCLIGEHHSTAAATAANCGTANLIPGSKPQSWPHLQSSGKVVRITKCHLYVIVFQLTRNHVKKELCKPNNFIEDCKPVGCTSVALELLPAELVPLTHYAAAAAARS